MNTTKKRIKLLSVLCCMALLISTIGCTAVAENSSDDFSPNESLVNETDSDVIASFIGRLDYVKAKEDGFIECSLLVEALEGSFKAEVDSKDISFDGDFAEATDVSVVSNDGSVMEVSFVLPKGEFDADNFSVEATVLLADGVLLDNEGRAVGEIAEVAVYTFNENDRAVYTSEPVNCTLSLSHDGNYTVAFYVSWVEVVGVNDDGTYKTETVDWGGNGTTRSSGFSTKLGMSNVVKVKVSARTVNAFINQTFVNLSGLSTKMSVAVSGTAMDPTYTQAGF